MHIDSKMNTTTKGTRQDVDALIWQIRRECQRTAVWAIEYLKQIAPVDVVVVPDNHAELNTLTIGEYLSAWFRNDKNCIWALEDNELFDKPTNWDDVISESVKALKACGLDFGAIDLRIQSAKNSDGELNEYPEFIIVEINSAPSFGEITKKVYQEEIPKMLTKKYNNEKK